MLNNVLYSVSLPIQGFISFYCYDGLLRERPFEILAYVAGVIVIIVYTVGNFAFEFTRLRGSPDEGEFILRIVSDVVITSQDDVQLSAIIMYVCTGVYESSSPFISEFHLRDATLGQGDPP